MRKRTIIRCGAATIVCLFLLSMLFLITGCTTYKGGKVVDGTNLEIGISVPGSEWNWTINALSYTGGLKVCGDERTSITVTNEVAETNSYFGVIKTQRHTKMSSLIEPVYLIVPGTNDTCSSVYILKPSKKK